MPIGLEYTIKELSKREQQIYEPTLEGIRDFTKKIEFAKTEKHVKTGDRHKIKGNNIYQDMKHSF